MFLYVSLYAFKVLAIQIPNSKNIYIPEIIFLALVNSDNTIIAKNKLNKMFSQIPK